ncbi:MAG: NAD-glutamate dehydrogenase [Chloroflexales bacterium]|nr:NAD-glutamate dehydrogenase [Chloroflexales bacterium]
MSDHMNARDPDDRLDSVLRHELRWEAPPELTARLLSLIPGAPMLAIAPARPKTWYSMLVLVLTAVALGLSLAVAWQIYSVVGAELGLAAIIEQLRYAPMIGLQRLYEALPASRQAVAVLVAVRDQLHWLLLAIILWLALDGWQPRLRRAPASR